MVVPASQGVADRQAGVGTHTTKTKQTSSCSARELGLIVEKCEGNPVPAVG